MRKTMRSLLLKMKNETIKTIEKDGCVYIGTLKLGLKSGRGLFFDGQSVYDGEFALGKRHGKGVLRTLDGEEYDGEWKRGKPFGIVYYRNFQGVRGRIKYNRKGVEVERKLRPSLCEFKPDESKVKRIDFVDGDVYIGETDENGELTGFGKREGKDGALIEGWFFKGQPHGFARLRFWDGAEIVGTFYRGGANGYCKRTDADGKVSVGMYENGSQKGWLVIDGKFLPYGTSEETVE